MSEADRAATDEHRQQPHHAVAAGLRRVEQHERALHRRESRHRETENEEQRARQERLRGVREADRHHEVEQHAHDEQRPELRVSRQRRHAERAEQGSEAFHAREHADLERREPELVRTEHRHHGDHRKAPDVEHDGNRQDALHDRQPAEFSEGRAHGTPHAPGGPWRPPDRRGQAEQDAQRQTVGHARQQERAIHARGGVEPAAEDRPRHARARTRDRVEAHRRAHAGTAGDIGQQRPPHGKVHRPCHPRHERPDRDVPDRQPTEDGQPRQARRHRRQYRKGDQQHALAVEAARHLSTERPEEGQRQHAQHQHGGDEKRRAGLFEHEDADGQHFQPPRRRRASAGQPHAQEVRFRKQGSRRARAGHAATGNRHEYRK